MGQLARRRCAHVQVQFLLQILGCEEATDHLKGRNLSKIEGFVPLEVKIGGHV